MNGKGDTTRPLSVPRETFDDNWDLAFGKKSGNEPERVEGSPVSGTTFRKIAVPLIEDNLEPLERTMVWENYKTELYERYQENNRGSRESENTSEA